MQRVVFSGNRGYKPSIEPASDRLFIPLAVINDLKAQKNGTKKTVFWVKKKKKQEDGTVKGEKWSTSQQYSGDWKENKKHGYGIKIYDNKDKYEGYWENDLRNGKGTYWLCIGKNKYRKLYTGDWKNNQKEGHGIYFYKDGSCYDGEWKNSKRDGKGLMIYANEDIYQGSWKEDKKHGHGILEKANGDKYYGYWNSDMKEGQGYYWYSKTGKVYLGEWHEDCPRCGIFTDVNDDKLHIDLSKVTDPKEIPASIPELSLKNPEGVLEESINSVYFIRSIKEVKNKNLQELFKNEDQKEIIKMYSQLRTTKKKDDEDENKIPDFTIPLDQLKKTIKSNLDFDLSNDILETIFYALKIPFTEETKVDFLLFFKIYYLIYTKVCPKEEYEGEQEMQGEEQYEEGNEEMAEQNNIEQQEEMAGEENEENYEYEGNEEGGETEEQVQE
jgi:hypothetical protein